MSARNTEKNLVSSIAAFETLEKLIESALKSAKPNKVKKLSDYRVKLEDVYMKLDSSWKLYKCDVFEKDNISEEVFDSTVDEEPKYKFNSAWSVKLLNRFIELTDDIDEAIEEAGRKPEDKSGDNLDDQMKLLEKVKTEIEQTEEAVKKFVDELDEVEEFTEVKYRGIGAHIQKFRVRVASVVELNESVGASTVDVKLFEQTIEAKLQSLEISTLMKLKDSAGAQVDPRTSSYSRPFEKVDLEKSKPPKFLGDMCEYPEFKRRFESIVGKANLPQEAFLDKLRDSLPKDAKEMLYGVTERTKAWSILDERFGNRKLIALKLKNQLKTLKTEGTNDPERVISLVIKVRSIETKLNTLEMSEALKYDDEFLSAVYSAMPRDYQKQWLLKEGEGDWGSMREFLEVSYKQANKELALLSSYEYLGARPKIRTNRTVVKANKEASDDDEHEEKSKREKAEEYCGKCPVCKKKHTWVRRDGKPWPSDRLISCKKFKDMNVIQRATSVQKSTGCPRCLSWNHQRDECKMTSNSCGNDLAGVKCSGDHSKLLCGSGNVYCAVFNASQHVSAASDRVEASGDAIDEDGAAIFYLQDVPVENAEKPAKTFWDNGSNRCIVRDDYAASQDLQSQAVTYTLEGVGGKEENVTGKIYKFKLVDRYGVKHPIWAYGYTYIMSYEAPDTSSLMRKLPHVPKEAFLSMQAGEIDLLMGLNFNHLFPEGGTNRDKVGGMRALRSLFGCGWVIGGCDKSIIQQGTGGKVNPAVTKMKCAKVEINANKSKSDYVLAADFLEKDEMGVTNPRVCERCLQCLESGACSHNTQQHTRKEQAELDLIKKNMEIKDGEVWCNYPFVKDPKCLSNNRATVVKVAEKVRKDLVRDGLLEAYNKQVKQIIDRKAAVELTEEEMEKWTGSFQYITHHAVLKDSMTTPVRMVTNSSFKNGNSSLNSCLVSGPNSLNSMLEVLLRFRSYESVCVYDLLKAYNMLRTTEIEKNLRRFVWKFSDEENWKDYAFDRAHFGDKCVATQLEVAKEMIADLPEANEIDPEACQRIKQDTYVDDGLTGGTPGQVDRFIGVRDQESDVYTGTFQKILSLGNFKMKAMVRDGDENQELADLMGNSALGYVWRAKDDEMAVKFPVNLSKKKRGVRVESNYSSEDVDKLKLQNLTKRKLLGFVNGFGDVLGIAQPWYMKLKMLMRKLTELENPLGWDETIPPDQTKAWLDVITEALIQGELTFPRSTRPKEASGEGPLVAGFADGAPPGYGGSIYLRWTLNRTSSCESETCQEDNTYDSNLAFSKARVCPMRGYSVPRTEVCGLLLLSRMMLIVLRALNVLQEKPAGAVMFSDSKCTISSLSTLSRNLLPFFQNRVCEILENVQLMKKYCAEIEILYVPGELNPADILTRGQIKLADLTLTCRHMKGPDFLCQPRSEWPVSASVEYTPPPEEEMRLKTPKIWAAAVRAVFCAADLVPQSSNLFKITEGIAHYSNSLRKATRILARYLRGRKMQHAEIRMDKHNPTALTLIAAEPTKPELETARKLLLLHGMIPTYEALNAGKLTSLMPKKEGRLIVTTGRLGETSLSRLLGVSRLPILMTKSRVAWLYMVRAHFGEFQTDHCSIVGTLARSRTHVWIVKGRNLAKTVVNWCPKCKLTRRKLEAQRMSRIKEEQVTVSPPWTIVSLDFAGPVLVKGVVNTRTRRKVWVLIYCDMATRAVCLLATTGYSTQDFLLKHEEFVMRKGSPRKIVSDKGSQLVSSSHIVAEKDKPCNKVNWGQVQSETSEDTHWEFVPSGCQWRNGICESTVKILKKSLSYALPCGVVLSYAELITLLARITHSINSRPLSVAAISPTSQQEDMLMPITANQLLLGRSTLQVPEIEYDESNKLCQRLAYVQDVHETWWARWVRDVLPTLIPCKKWKSRSRNLSPGDVVMLTYQGNFTNDYRLAMVKNVFPDEDGLVRTVEIEYRRRDKRESSKVYWKKPLTVERIAVQRLSLLVPVNQEGKYEEHPEEHCLPK